MNLIIIFHEKRRDEVEITISVSVAKAQTDVTVFFFIFTHIYTDATWCSWHGELIKMMFSLRGALRFFAFL
jgi:hypothetical protein